MTNVSTKPYLIRAIHEWCVDQGFTPHLAVLVGEGVVVPPGHARDGQIVLNIGPDATSKLVMGNDAISFQARFGGASHALFVPVANVLAVYARETGQGMAFEVEQQAEPGERDAGAATEDVGPTAPEESPTGETGSAPATRGGHLKVIK